MIGVGKRCPGDLPCLCPADVVVINQDAHQFGNGDRRMGVVELDGSLVREGIERAELVEMFV